MLHRSTLTNALRVSVLMAVELIAIAIPAFARRPPVMVKESLGGNPAGGQVPCSAPASIDGTCGSYRWYNLCSGYIWLYVDGDGDEFGTSFKASDGMPCIAPGNIVKRVITYFRNVVPTYGMTVNVFLNGDTDADGCAENSEPIIAADRDMDPALRWNCSNFGVAVPEGITALIVSFNFGTSLVTFATDGAGYPQCPLPVPHTFYYGIGRTQCMSIIGPSGTYDNWLVWLVMDSPVNATEPTTWGGIKGLYR